MITALLFRLQQNTVPPLDGAAAPRTTDSAVEPTAQLFRFLFSAVPQWVQIAGIIIGGTVATVGVWHFWKHRRRLWAWFSTRSRVHKAALVGALAVVALLVGGAGLYNYNYVMHNNDFCSSCHIMNNAWNRFQVSAHKELGCHDCHRQSMLASTKELYWWVLERRMAVPAHDKVPTAICSECHQRLETDSARTNVLLTAGHVLHLQSDSSALADVQCTTCHGRDFHTFSPNNATCSQSGCHTGVSVKLGAMSQAGFLHCTSCHEFRTGVVRGATEADAKRGVTPVAVQCGSCHVMAEKIAEWDLAADPHEGTCGMCHNAHKQTEPRDAFQSCATAQCHASADTLTRMHRGLGTHTLNDCSACHQAHSWKVKGTDCLSCHKTIFNDRPPARPRDSTGVSGLRHAPQPVNGGGSSGAASPRPAAPPRHAPGTPESAVIRDVSARRDAEIAFGPRHARRAHQRTAPSLRSRTVRDDPALRTVRIVNVANQQPAQGASRRVTTSDTTFLHSRHRTVACTDCHTSAATHGGIKVTAPRDCLACHHGPTQVATCTNCHVRDSLGTRAKAVTFSVSARPAPVTRSVAFPHARHADLECARCHGPDERRTVAAETCNSCHTGHHRPTRECSACHTTARTGHFRTAHDGCASCHTPDKLPVGRLTRSLCVACHQDRTTHYVNRDCADCHVVPDNMVMRGAPPR